MRGKGRSYTYPLLNLNLLRQLENVPVTYTLSPPLCGHWIIVGMVRVSATSTSSSSIVAVDAMLPLLGIPSAPVADKGGSTEPEGISDSFRPVAIVKGVPGAVVVWWLETIKPFSAASSSSSMGVLADHPDFSFHAVADPVPDTASAMLSRRIYWALELRPSSPCGITPKKVGW